MGAGITPIRWFREPNLASPDWASLLEMNLSMRRVGVAGSSVVVIQILTIE